MAAVIGSLRVNLGIDSAQFQKGLKQAQGGMAGFARHAKVAAAAAAAAFAAAAVAISRSFAGIINEADQLAKMSQSLGVPIEELSRLKHAADLSGTSFDALAKSAARLSKAMSDSLRSATGEQAAAFKALGINVTGADGVMRSSTEVMSDIADRFSKMADGSTKTSLAVALFGQRIGPQLIPLLNQGSDGIRKMTEEADALGLTITGKTGKAAELFNDSLTRMQAAMKGVLIQAFQPLIPIAARMAEKWADGQKKSDLLKGAVWLLNGALKQLMIVTSVGVGVWRAFGAVVTAVVNAVRLVSKGEFGGAWDELKSTGSSVKAVMKETAEEIRNIWFELSDGADKAKNNTDAATDSGKKLVTTLGKASEGIRDTFLRDSFFDGAKTSLDGMRGIARSVESAFDSMFSSAIDGTFNLKDAVRSLASDMARMFANRLFRQIIGGMSGGGAGLFGGLFGGGGSGSAGQLMGFANGGSFKVGGAGGIDSQMVAFRASPNERVSVTKPGQTMQGNAPVNIYTNAGPAEVQTRQRSDGGTDIEVIFDGLLAKKLPKANRKLMPQQFGVAPALAQR